MTTQAREVITNRRHDMRYRLILTTMVLVSCVAPARAQLLPPIFPGPGGGTPQRFILRAPGGIGVVQTLCGLIGCGLLESLGDPGSQVFVISTSSTALLNNLLLSLGITHIEPDLLVSLLPAAPLISNATGVPDGLWDTNPVQFYGSTVWNGYASQPAANAVRANEARDWYHVAGAGTIGIIDTGVDPNHPALQPILVPGYDFTRNQPGSGSEMADLNQSTVAVLDSAPAPAVVNGSTMAVLDQSTVAVLDQSGFAAFGHGTMVAGIVHLVAPTSQIMPLKAFGPDGTGFTSDIIRAVYFAVPQVNALNMSFSMPQPSAELGNALDYAAAQSVVSVAAAGNDGTATVVYPAGFQNDVMGVGSTSLYGTRSTFSNYGSVVWVAAPGEGIISTYPCGTYAAGWGTSFSAPFVTGTVGLLTNLRLLNEQSASSAIANADPIGGDLGHGELDVVQALNAIQTRP